MPKIEITEKDLTRPGGNVDNTDIVYIPGFVDVKNNFADYSNALEKRKPTLFTSVEEFEAKCGKQGAKFKTAQYYKQVADGVGQGFEEVAVPYDGIMFAANTEDPGYVMAKELLAQGLNVLYERVNDGADNEKFTEAQWEKEPANWKSLLDSLEYQVTGCYAHITSGKMPELTTKVNGKKFDSSAEYYTRDIKGGKVIYSPVADTSTISQDAEGIINGDILYYVKDDSCKLLEKPGEDEHYSPNTYVYETDGYFQLDSSAQLAPADFPTNYYTFEVIDSKTYEANKYYTRQDLKFYLSKSQSAEAGKEYYALTPVANTTKNPAVYKPNTFVKFDNGDKNEGTLITETFRPFPGDYYKLTTPLLVSVGDSTDLTIPENWINSWQNFGVTEAAIWKPVKSGQETLPFVPNTKYRYIEDQITISTMYNALYDIFDTTSPSGLMDKGNYSFKYLTSGGYPVYEYSEEALVIRMLEIAKNRGDCVAFIDHTDNLNREQNITYEDSLYRTVANDTVWKVNGEFATMFTPWATYRRSTNERDITGKTLTNIISARLPASFAYLMALADSIKTNANWLAIAGSARGTVLHLEKNGITTVIPNGVADEMQPRKGFSINPITNINPYGNIIWGNRTLKDNASAGGLTASSFLNIRNLVSDIKKQAYKAARKLTFEQNTDTLWLNFKALMNPLLDRMVSGYGLTGYKMAKDEDKMRELRSLGEAKASMCVKIIVTPVEPVEDFYISIILKDDDVSVVEA